MGPGAIAGVDVDVGGSSGWIWSGEKEESLLRLLRRRSRLGAVSPAVVVGPGTMSRWIPSLSLFLRGRFAGVTEIVDVC